MTAEDNHPTSWQIREWIAGDIWDIRLGRRWGAFANAQMARFMIHWCAPDPTNVKYTQAIVDYIKGGKPMDEYAGFKVLARQIHPHLGGGVLLVEADNLAAVQKHTYPWTKGLGVTATITPGLSDEEYVELEESMNN